MHSSRMWSVLACGVAAIALAGCGGGGDVKVKHPDCSSAAGVVTYNDKPVEGARVMLISADTKKNGWGCTGNTDAGGKFEITTSFAPSTQVKGIPPGDYSVLVTKIEKLTTAEMEAAKKEGEENQKKIAAGADPASLTNPGAPKNLVPAKYADEFKSDLKVKVEKAGNTNIDLKLAD